MNNNKSRILVSIGVVFVVVSLFIIGYIKKSSIKQNVEIEKNYGISYMKTVIDISDNTTINNIDSVVPNKIQIVNNLKQSGYMVKEHEISLDTKLNTTRIYAEKENEYIDITYCNNVDDAKQVFEVYEKQYKEFYLMAQNVTCAYCISNKEAFDEAGFTSLANNGIQYINHNEK